MMAVPLLVEERALGVLEVLDRPHRPGFELAEMDLLGLFAAQAAIALDLLARARRAQEALGGQGAELAVVSRVAAALDRLEGPRREAGLQLLSALEELLRQD
jgi:GAF domain-containing protein